eukprot:CAMPEP_0197440208 /NCGR_PEP_ID=MMETSP1175-20131217/6772_1 /TAXON_ID=1003142 /ORGANISM="Triceratium dubium, Strain CCMP147" /LENGTH=173 /DNA_ID=CAMNT_0042970277 /DNA_START=207 /DNA_END=728 /DNA_ORIENTATION=+
MAFRATAIRLAAKLTEAERTAALKDANARMRDYYVNRPPIEKVKPKKSKWGNPRADEHFIQLGLVASFVTAFLATPFLGRKIALDEEFREKYIPKAYDFTLEKPDHAWTREELHEQFVQVQRELHERAIRGEFSPEKLDEMRRHFAGVDPKDDPHGWGQLHPGVDEDEDLEDD